MRSNFILLGIVLCFYSPAQLCWAQMILSKTLDVHISRNEKPDLRPDTATFHFVVDNSKNVKSVYLTFGFVDSLNCSIHKELYNTVNEKANKNHITYLINGNNITIKVFNSQYNLNLFNYARLNFSDNKGEYSESIWFKDSWKLDKVPCNTK